MAIFVLPELLYVREKARQGADEAEALRALAVQALRAEDGAVSRAEWLAQFSAACQAHLHYLQVFHDTLWEEESGLDA
jgi:hypothetical protein